MIITRYLVKEMFSTLVGVLLVLLLIAFSGQLVGLFSKVAEGTIRADTVMTLFGVYSLTLVPFVLPLALYLAILLALSRLYMNSEITVLEACGYGPYRLLRPVLAVAVVTMLVQGAFSLWLGPWGDAQGERLEKLTRKALTIEGITPGRFRSLPEGQGVLYAERINPERTRIFNVFAQIRIGGHDTLVVAESAHIEADEAAGVRYLVLENGHRYEGVPGEADFVVVRFRRHSVRMTPRTTGRHIDYHLRSLSTATLLQRPQAPGYLTELQWRVSSALLCVSLAILALPLAHTSPRGGRYGRLAVAFVLYLMVNNLLTLGRTWLMEGMLPPAMGLWWVHGVIALTGLVLIWWQTGGPRRLRSARA